MLQNTNDRFFELVMALIVLTVAAMAIERILNFVYDARPIRGWIEQWSLIRALKAWIALAFCGFLCVAFEADIFKTLFPDAGLYALGDETVQKIAIAKEQLKSATAGSVERVTAEIELTVLLLPKSHPLGVFLTAFLLAGGSAGMMTLFQETLGMSNAARQAQRKQRTAAALRASRLAGSQRFPASTVGQISPRRKPDGHVGFSS